ATKIDREACRAAYNLVRDDGSAVIWVTFKYDGSTTVPAEYQHFIQQCTDDVRLFAFVRFTTGDAMSKMSKFALILWIGEDISGLQCAKTGTDKTLIKEVVQNFAKEFELEEDFIKSELKKVGVANYYTQTHPHPATAPCQSHLPAPQGRGPPASATSPPGRKEAHKG
uniref:Coactosin-like protein n=1 Tax=Cebus imitator TaxID=2715852 RepID=A0A2K5RW43_CEBIM